jgi:hypothetical protein
LGVFGADELETNRVRHVLHGLKMKTVSMNKKMIQGECSCRAIQFEMPDDFKYAFYCHCSLCRKRSGSAFASIGGIESEKINVTLGEALVFKDGETTDGYRAVCSKCNAHLFSVLMDQKRAHVNLGALKDEPSRKPDHHIYVASKASWYEIQDSLPQYAELPT